jgi:protein-L-isoaspartate O-methyltransferase
MRPIVDVGREWSYAAAISAEMVEEVKSIEKTSL